MAENFSSLCEEPHPEIDGVFCDKGYHPYGAHSNMENRKDWEDIPIPIATKSKKAKMADIINRAEPETKTGPPTGTILKERGMGRAIANSPEGWKEAFREEVKRQASTGLPFTSEDVTNVIGLPAGDGAGMNANNGVGAMMNSMARQGVIVSAPNRVTESQRDSRHGSRIGVWIGSQENSLPS